MSKSLFTLLLISLLLSGCINELIVDRIKIIQSIGLDLEGDTIKGSASYPDYSKGQEKAPLLLLTSQSQTIMGIFTSFSNQSEHPAEYGKMRTCVISELFAKRGISELAADVIRDPIKGDNTTITITKDKARKILAETLKLSPFYLSELIEQNIENGNTPLNNIHTFMYQYYGEGQDVYLPVVSRSDEGKLFIDGVGVFKADKLKLLLSNKQGLLLKLLRDDIKSGSSEFTTDQNDKIFLKISHGKRKITIENDEKVTVTLKLAVILTDYPENINLTDKKEVIKLTKQIENKFDSEIKKILEYLQANETDPIGIGDRYQSKAG
ncbi:Ger(x)C family spore germination protein [Paenibacillus psychroresistens]|nr:Ger(x)C family spore germination protein [Paenibacillus psychroresistens]